MAHGIGGTRDSGLLPFAEAFAEAGLDALLFDYRCFGELDRRAAPVRQAGLAPRRLSRRRRFRAWARRGRSRADRPLGHVVVGRARRLRRGRGRADRGGHLPDAGPGRPSHPAARSRATAASGSWRGSLPTAIRDAAGALRGREPHLIPIAARPGTAAAMSSEEAAARLRGDRRADLAQRDHRARRPRRGPKPGDHPDRRAQLPDPDPDRRARLDRPPCSGDARPPGGPRAASEVREYPCAHFDVYVGKWRERAIEDQLHFLRRHLSPAPG